MGYLNGDYDEEIGSEMADRDFYDNFGYLFDKRNGRDPKSARISELNERYVIGMVGHKSGNMTFLQDLRIDDGGFWTQYLSNALGFDTEAEARDKMREFRYGNPRVAIVDKKGNYRFIKS